MPFKQLQGTDYDLGRVQQNVQNAFQELYTANPILGERGGVFKQVSLSTSDTIVTHGLGRVFQGYILCGSDAPTQPYTSSTVNLRPQDQIILKGSASAKILLYVF